MKRTSFTNERAELAAGAHCPDLCRKHGMSEAAFYVGRGRLGRMTVSDAPKKAKTMRSKLSGHAGRLQ